MKVKIPQYEPYLDWREAIALIDCVDRNWITGGPKVEMLECEIKKYTKVKHAKACFNGTVALFLALKACGVGRGDVVVVPDFTMAASAFAIEWVGAKPLFCDVDANTLCMTQQEVYRTIALRDKRRFKKEIKVIMPVGIFGNSPNMEELWMSCNMEMEDVFMVEDAAQDIGVTFTWKHPWDATTKKKAQHLGTFGDAGILSFYADKSISSGEGGVVLTNSDEIANECEILRNQGRLKRGEYHFDRIGYNLRMTDLQAAVGLAQFVKLPEIIKKKKQHEVLYRTLLSDIVGFLEVNERCFSVPFRHCILVDDPQGLADYLLSQGIETRRFFEPLHWQPAFKQFGYGNRDKDKDFPNTIRAYERGLCLPSSVKLTDGEIFYVCAKIREFCKGENQ